LLQQGNLKLIGAKREKIIFSCLILTHVSVGVFCAAFSIFPAGLSMGVLGELFWYHIRSGGALVFGVVTFPLQLVGNILSGLAGVVSGLFFPLRLRSDAHEPLQRRLTQLEDEVRKWKPLQDVIPKQLGHQPVAVAVAAAVGDHKQKLCVL